MLPQLQWYCPTECGLVEYRPSEIMRDGSPWHKQVHESDGASKAATKVLQALITDAYANTSLLFHEYAVYHGRLETVSTPWQIRAKEWTQDLKAAPAEAHDAADGAARPGVDGIKVLARDRVISELLRTSPDTLAWFLKLYDQLASGDQPYVSFHVHGQGFVLDYVLQAVGLVKSVMHADGLGVCYAYMADTRRHVVLSPSSPSLVPGDQFNDPTSYPGRYNTWGPAEWTYSSLERPSNL